MPELDGNIVLCGGDSREIELFRCWKKAGIAVKMAGFELADEIENSDKAGEADFEEAAVFIAPLSGISGDGTVNAFFSHERLQVTQCLARSRPGVIVVAGMVEQSLRKELSVKCTLLISGADEELALLNAIPTAEGAIQEAMELSAVTLHGSTVLVIGMGRCGAALARALQGLGASVRVLVRRRESAAQAYSQGYVSFGKDDAGSALSGADFIFNTAPATVLTAHLLKEVGKDAIILDLASAPGGVDFDAAAALGLRAKLLPSLPGKAAPRTAGKILSQVYRRLIVGAREKRKHS